MMSFVKNRQHQRLVQQLLQLSSTQCKTGCVATQLHHGNHKLSSLLHFKPKFAHVHTSSVVAIPRGKQSHHGGTTKVLGLRDSSEEVDDVNHVATDGLLGTQDTGFSGTYIIGKEGRADNKFVNEDITPTRHSEYITDYLSHRQQKEEIKQDLAAVALRKFARKWKGDSQSQAKWTNEGRSYQRTKGKGLYDNELKVSDQRSNNRDQRSEERNKKHAQSQQDDGWFHKAKDSEERDAGKKSLSSRSLRKQVLSSGKSPADVRTISRVSETSPATSDEPSMDARRITSPTISEAYDPSAETKESNDATRVISERRMLDGGWKVTDQRKGQDGWKDDEWKTSKRHKEKRNKSERKKPKDDKKSKSAVYSPASDNDILFGIAPCWLALQQNRRIVYRAFVSPSLQASDRREARGILGALEDKVVELEVVHTDILDKLSGGRPHQGVCIESSSLEHFTLSDREEVLSSQVKALLPDHSTHSVDVPPPLWLALDQVKDPMNFGAVLRSSYFFGVDRVITCTQNSCPLSPVVSKASSGVMEIYDVYAAMDMTVFLQCMTDSGWQVIGAISSNGVQSRSVDCVPCEEFIVTQPSVVVIGNEGIGMRPEIETKCSKFVTIQPGRELHPGMDSLNVSVATGVLLHSLMRGISKKT